MGEYHGDEDYLDDEYRRLQERHQEEQADEYLEEWKMSLEDE